MGGRPPTRRGALSQHSPCWSCCPVTSAQGSEAGASGSELMSLLSVDPVRFPAKLCCGLERAPPTRLRARCPLVAGQQRRTPVVSCGGVGDGGGLRTVGHGSWFSQAPGHHLLPVARGLGVFCGPGTTGVGLSWARPTQVESRPAPQAPTQTPRFPGVGVWLMCAPWSGQRRSAASGQAATRGPGRVAVREVSLAHSHPRLLTVWLPSRDPGRVSGCGRPKGQWP